MPRRRAVAAALTAVGLAGGISSAWAVDTVVKHEPPPPAAAAPEAAPELTTPFTVSGAEIREATLSPRPSAGSEVLLPSNDSTAAIEIGGGGKVVLALAGESSCEGAPVVAVDIDGQPAGTVEVTDQDEYLIAEVGPRVPLGMHEVTVQMVNDSEAEGCDRAAILSSAHMEFTDEAPVNTLAAPRVAAAAPEVPAEEAPAADAPAAKAPAEDPAPEAADVPAAGTPVLGGKPGPSNTGVPDGTPLTVHKGNLVITKPGTVVDGMDIQGLVQVKADNVTIRNSVVRGGSPLKSSGALIESWWGAKNLLITDTTLQAANPSVNVDGISGSNFTAERLDIYDVVDQVKVIGSNVTIRNSWLHDNFHSENDPNQADGKTHDDNVQIESGTAIVLEGNVLSGAHNAAIMLTQNKSVTSNVRIAGNWIADGACTINADEKGRGPFRGIGIMGNVFGEGRFGDTCAMRLPKTSSIAVDANTWDGVGTAANANHY